MPLKIATLFLYQPLVFLCELWMTGSAHLVIGYFPWEAIIFHLSVKFPGSLIDEYKFSPKKSESFVVPWKLTDINGNALFYSPLQSRQSKVNLEDYKHLLCDTIPRETKTNVSSPQIGNQWQSKVRKPQVQFGEPLSYTSVTNGAEAIQRQLQHQNQLLQGRWLEKAENLEHPAWLVGSSVGWRMLSKHLTGSQPSLLLRHALGGRRLIWLISFRYFLKLFSGLLPELNARWTVSPPFRTPWVISSFPPRWNVSSRRKLCTTKS